MIMDLSFIQSGFNIFVHTAACASDFLIQAVLDEVEKRNLKDIKFYHLHIEGTAPHVSTKWSKLVQTNCFFVGRNCREAVQAGRASYIPVFLSEIPKLFSERIIPIDVALVQVSPFDDKGHTTLGPSVDITMTAVHCAKYVLGQINKFIPRVLGDGILSRSDFHLLIEHDNEIVAHDCSDLSDSAKTIGHFVASLIDDGATLQMGIGDIPNAVLSNLVHHKHLGIHTEMFSDGVIPLLESGVVDNRYKKIHPYKVVSSFAVGSRKLYDFLDNNSLMQFMGSDFVNDPRVILKNPKVCAINSALEVDLTGQVCADSIGPKIYSGVGGQVDFMRGAALSEGGKAIIALPSRTGRGLPKIVSGLRAGAGVVTSRAHVQFIVTEFGIADLRGKSLKERTRLLIQLAHPDDRENLEREAHQFNWV